MNIWYLKKIKINEKSTSLLDILRLKSQKPTGNFYESSYICPYCKNWLYKTVFPVGKEYPIITNQNLTIKMKRVFGCGLCQTFFTAANDKLSDGIVYEFKTSDKNKYKNYFLDMNEKGTLQGRPD